MNSQIVNAYIYEPKGDGESLLAPTAEDAAFAGIDNVIQPPYPPLFLCKLFERSHALRPPVDCYITNIESFGYRLEPSIKLDSEDSDDMIRSSLVLEAIFDGPEDEIPEISDEQVNERRALIERESKIERLQIDAFFRHCCSDMAYIELLRRLRQDEEITGNSYFEVVRDSFGEIREFNHSPSVSTRLRKAGPMLSVESPQKVSAVSYRQAPRHRRFRSFVQVIGGQNTTFFKEFGDRRLMSSQTGTYFDSAGEMKRKEPQATPATEMIHNKIYSSKSVYGIPRWIGAWLSVIGTREAEEVNYAYFHDKTIPPFAVLVSGGGLRQGAGDKIRDYLNQHIRGKDNFHNVLVLEAENKKTSLGTQSTPRTRIEIVPLQQFQQQDALFQRYDERNAEKVRNMFRIPKILVGDAADVNRATAEAALRQSEQQVFQPERARRNYAINHMIFADMGIRFWQYAANSPVSTDPVEASNVLRKLAPFIRPNEARSIVAAIINEALPTIDEPWAKLPLEVYRTERQTAGIAGDETAPPASDAGTLTPAGPDLLEQLTALRDELRRQAETEYSREDAEQRQKLNVPAEVMASWIA